MCSLDHQNPQRQRLEEHMEEFNWKQSNKRCHKRLGLRFHEIPNYISSDNVHQDPNPYDWPTKTLIFKMSINKKNTFIYFNLKSLGCHLNVMFENKLWHRKNKSFMSCVCIRNFLLKMRQKWNRNCSSSLSEQYTHMTWCSLVLLQRGLGDKTYELCELWCSISVHVSMSCTRACLISSSLWY